MPFTLQSLKKLGFKKIIKIIGLAIVALILLRILLSLLDVSLMELTPRRNRGYSGRYASESAGLSAGMMADSVAGGVSMKTSSLGSAIRNIKIPKLSLPTPQPEPTPGNDAEAFEVTEYNGTYERSDIEPVCDAIAALKSRKDVIFERANNNDQNCSFVFKVERDKADDVLTILQSLHPKTLNVQTYTVKNTIEDYATEIEMLELKQQAIDETLQDAIDAYDELSDLAVQVRDVENLNKIIDNKIRLIERLTQERLNLVQRFEQIAKQQAQQMDKMEYTYFRISVYENKLIDVKSMGQSWKQEIKHFFGDVNDILQGTTVRLITVVLMVIQYAVYILVLLFIGKFVWNTGQSIWKK